jgi:ABC-type bacteriocin/lantibiotic exporter with double-glycine peptidase domain
VSDTSTVLSVVKLNLLGFKVLMEWHGKMLLFESNQLKTISDNVSGNLNSIKIELNNVSFGYNEKDFIIQDLSLSVTQGEILVIKGESGAGKSTLISLLAGFNKPSKGFITINGVDLIKIQDLLLSSTGYVGPEPYLIAGTVRENLTYGFKEPTTDEQLWSALEIAQLKKEITSMSRGLEEPLNELTQLSTGQKQRLSIARAILRKPKLLILDEATANLDPVTEKDFINRLKQMSSELTTIIISHKNTFDQIATKTLSMKKL